MPTLRHWFVVACAVGVLFALSCTTANTTDLVTAPAVDPSAAGSDSGATPDENAHADSGANADAGASERTGGDEFSHDVTIQVEPNDSGEPILEAIKAATKSVHMTMYLLTNHDVQNALISLHQEGKDVKVVLNQNFPPNSTTNASAYKTLANANVDVVWAPSDYTFTHEKAVIIDAAKVLIMTMNLTASSATSNREYIATDTDTNDVADAEAVFEADYHGWPVTVGGKLVVSPEQTQPIGPRDRLKALIESATSSLDIEVQELSDTGLTDAIIASHAANVAVRVVTTAAGDRNETPAQVLALTKLKQAGVPVVGLGNPYIHAKAIVVDDKLVFVGSQNFTPTALFENREVGVVTDTFSEVIKVRDVIAADFQNGTLR